MAVKGKDVSSVCLLLVEDMIGIQSQFADRRITTSARAYE